jgi:hypothetical protein
MQAAAFAAAGEAHLTGELGTKFPRLSWMAATKSRVISRLKQHSQSARRPSRRASRCAARAMPSATESMRSDVPYDVPTIAVIVVIGIAIALVMCWGAHLFERWWWSRRA